MGKTGEGSVRAHAAEASLLNKYRTNVFSCLFSQLKKDAQDYKLHNKVI